VLTVRTSPALTPEALEHSRAIERALLGHPLAPHVVGTIILGASGTGVMAVDDARPRVIVVLDAHDGRRRLAAANIARADALVLMGDALSPGVRTSVDAGVPVITTGTGRPATPAFLTGTTEAERTAAWGVIRHQPALDHALATADAADAAVIAQALAAVADAIIEAVAAAGRG